MMINEGIATYAHGHYQIPENLAQYYKFLSFEFNFFYILTFNILNVTSDAF